MVDFVYSRKDVFVVVAAAAIFAALVGVGFGVASANDDDGTAEENKFRYQVRHKEQTSRERAIEILEEAPIVDG